MSLVFNSNTQKYEITDFAKKVHEARHRENDPYYYSPVEARNRVVREELLKELHIAKSWNNAGEATPTAMALGRIGCVLEFLLTEGRI